MNAYQNLEQTFKNTAVANDILSMLHWDAATQMPEGSASARSDQMAFLALYVHDILQKPTLMDDVARAKDEDLNRYQKANLAEMERLLIHAQALPRDLVGRMTKANNATEVLWREAKKKADFKMLEKALTEMFDLAREAGEIKADKLGCSPYEALMDEFDPGTRTAEIDMLFGDLKTFLKDLLPQVMEKQKAEGNPLEISGLYALDKLLAFYKSLMQQLGFDFNKGRIDESTHPFCGGITADIRITTWANEKDFRSPLLAVVHETGHALYEAGLPQDFNHQPGGKARGMAMHESQSLLFEKQVGLNQTFIEGIMPKLNQSLGTSFKAQDLWQAMTRVRPSLIRVDADEVTYPFHVMLRYEIEKGIIEGQYRVSDLPELWHAKMEEFLGVTPSNDASGCLQDIHWPSGAIGYFPSYTMGAVIAAQLFDAAKAEHSEIESELKQGKTDVLLTWLRKNVHEKASLFSRNAILEAATGEKLSVEPFKKHLKQRYLEM